MIPKLKIMKEKIEHFDFVQAKIPNEKDTIKVCLTHTWIFWSQRLNCKHHQANRQYLILPWTWISLPLKLLSYIFCPTETLLLALFTGIMPLTWPQTLSRCLEVLHLFPQRTIYHSLGSPNLQNYHYIMTILSQRGAKPPVTLSATQMFKAAIN